MMFEQEACEACKSFAETAGAILAPCCGASKQVETIQENNPPQPTLASILVRPGTD